MEAVAQEVVAREVEGLAAEDRVVDLEVEEEVAEDNVIKSVTMRNSG